MKGTAVAGWLAQRGQDLLLWPLNLVRDLPRRASRLGGSLLAIGQGLLFVLPELLDALRHNDTKRWLRYKAGRILFRGHALLAQTFDLAGGPEICQILLRPLGHATPLTSNEIASITYVLGPDALRLAEVRVLEGGLMNVVFRLNGNFAFAAWHTVCLPVAGRHTRANRPILIHELTHVYQYENVGTRYLGEAVYMLIKTKRDCYNYGGAGGLELACAVGTRYSHFNREQQAMITQDYYTLYEQGADARSYEPFIADLRQGQL